MTPDDLAAALADAGRARELATTSPLSPFDVRAMLPRLAGHVEQLAAEVGRRRTARTTEKCEACGGVTVPHDPNRFVYVRTLNGGLNLCRECLAQINGKNPETKALRAERDRLREQVAACRRLFALPNWANRIGPWRDVNDAARAAADALKEKP